MIEASLNRSDHEEVMTRRTTPADIGAMAVLFLMSAGVDPNTTAMARELPKAAVFARVNGTPIPADVLADTNASQLIRESK